ncbi:hypothetical protein C8Q76DRAFT_700274 [Earliella scabrosa]|nr:hypothetical protein C8Q76DRAFT_700274 [Earliella scabrosa]
MHINKLPNPSPLCTLGDFGVGREHSCPPIEMISSAAEMRRINTHRWRKTNPQENATTQLP